MFERLERLKAERQRNIDKRAELDEKIKELEKDFLFYTWCAYDENRSVIRLVTNWNTTEEEMQSIIDVL